jgi:FtsH-binding integral membrane protein
MATVVHAGSAIAPINTTSPGAGNGESEDNTTDRQDCNGDGNGEIVMDNGIGSSDDRQDSMSMGNKFGFSSADSIHDDFTLLWGLRKYLVLLGTLAVSVTYNSGLTPPGGFWATNKHGHKAGDPILRVEFSQRYGIFFYCNATAFAASLVLIILLLSKSVTRHKLWLRSMQFTMLVDLFSLMGAYAAGSCRALKSSIYVCILVFSVFVYIWIHILVSTRVVPEKLKKEVKEMVTQILSCGFDDEQVSSHQEKDIEEARKFVLMLVTFAATVTYQAGLSPPGGFWAENDYAYKYRPATSILRSHYLHRYNIFVSCNSTSFVASLVTIILLLSPELSRHGIRSKAVSVCVVADILCLIGAYAAGCSRDLPTSFFVMLIIVIMLICIAVLARIFAYKAVADRLQKIKKDTEWCMDKLGQALSFASHHQDSIHASVVPTEDSAGKYQILNSTKHESIRECPPADEEKEASTGEASPNSCHGLESENTKDFNTTGVPTEHQQQVSNITEGKCSGECPPADEKKETSTEEAFSYSCHPSESENTKDLMSNQEHQSTDYQLVARTKETLPSTEQSSSYDIRTIDIPDEGFSDHNEASNDLIVGKGASPVEANGSADYPEVQNLAAHVEYAELPNLVAHNNFSIEILTVANDAENIEIGHTHSSQGAPDKNVHDNQSERHLKKTRTCLLLLAILAVSLTYQSGLNPPGGFWSRSENNHLAGDRILEDNEHPRFIAFFYFNAVAFVASFIMILIILSKSMSQRVTKRSELQIAMIVVLLSLTGAFVMGSCREAKKSIYISVLVCLVLAYVGFHVLISIHVIPIRCKNVVAEKLKNFWSALPQLRDNQRGNSSSETELEQKELERRHSLLLMLAIVAATVTYQAGINPPGGVWSDDRDVSGTPGNPILQDNRREQYDVFYYSNSVSFVSSVVITILLVNKESFECGIKSYALRLCLILGLLGLLIAFAAGSCRNKIQYIFLITIAVAVLVSLVIQALLPSIHDTLGKPLDAFVEFLQKWVFLTKKAGQEVTSKSSETLNCDKKYRRHKYLMLIAILAASITYQAGLNPPGGFWSDDKGHVAGNPLLRDINNQRYKIFFWFNSISFMASIVVIMLLLRKSVRKKHGHIEVLLCLVMILGMLALMIAFAAGSCRLFRTSVYVFVLVAGVVISLVFIVFLASAIAKFLRKLKRTGLSLIKAS